MTPALLIAGNFIREQRWLVALLVGWVAFVAAMFGMVRPVPGVEEAQVYIRQQAAYGLALGIFVISAAIYNERRSRRILAVLSKGIERREYLAGLLLGISGVIAIYSFAFALGLFWLAGRAGLPSADALPLAVIVLVAGVGTSSVALFFSTFMHPFVTTAATAFTVSMPLALGFALGADTRYVLAPAAIGLNVFEYAFQREWSPDWLAAGLTVVQALLIWLAATWIFGRKDLTAAVE